MDDSCYSSTSRFRIIWFSFMSFGLLVLILNYYFFELYNASASSDTFLASTSSSLGTSDERYKSIFLDKYRIVHHRLHFHHHRKLLASSSIGANEWVSNRVSQLCSKDDIAVYQGPTTPLPNGIPTYTVQILNVCVSGCSISGIHISCGWFSSARLINPRVFRRENYDDCLVNNGEALGPGESLSFQYANSFRYPLSVSSVTC